MWAAAPCRVSGIRQADRAAPEDRMTHGKSHIALLLLLPALFVPPRAAAQWASLVTGGYAPEVHNGAYAS